MLQPRFNESQNTWEIDVFGDGSCLFWAVALAYLIPVKLNEFRFQKRFKKLFGKESLAQLESVKAKISAYNPYSAEEAIYQDETLKELISKQFRYRVIKYIAKNKSQFEVHMEGDFEDYLNSMQNPNTSGGEPEIRAMSDLLDCRIQVITAQGELKPYGEEATSIQLFHVGATSANRQANHYHFGLEKSLGDTYQAALRPVSIGNEREIATSPAKRLDGKSEVDQTKKSKIPRPDYQLRRVVDACDQNVESKDAVNRNKLHSTCNEPTGKKSIVPQLNRLHQETVIHSMKRGGDTEKDDSEQSRIEELMKKVRIFPSLVCNSDPGSDERELTRSGKRFKPTLSEGGYDAHGLKLSLHGTVYQLKLLMLFLKRGLDNGYSFLLATEMDAAEKFDDVVFEYIDGQGQNKHRFLQAKHKQDESKKIGVNDLLTEKDGEFSLQKYFISYRRIKQNPRFSCSLLEDFVICTNIDFEFDESTSGKLKDTSKDPRDIRVEKLSTEDRILKLKDQTAPRYRFTLNKQSSEIQGPIAEILRDTSVSIRLARKLAEYVSGDQSLDLRNELFQSYHGPLGREIVDIEHGMYPFQDKFIEGDQSLSDRVKKFRKAFLEEASKIRGPVNEADKSLFWIKKNNIKNLPKTPGSKRDRQYSNDELTGVAKKLAHCVFKNEELDWRKDFAWHMLLEKVINIKDIRYRFYDKFIDGKDLSREAKTFRRHFLEAMLRMPENQADEEAFWRSMKERKLQLSSSFGKVVELNDNPHLANPKALAEKLADLLNRSQDNIVKAEETETESIKSEINKIAGHVLIEKSDKKTHFRSEFLKGNPLPGNLKNFREEFQTALLNKRISFKEEELNQYQFKIDGFKTYGEAQLYSKATLPNDTVDDGEIEEFLNKLVFAVNQPNEIKLSELLKQETGEEFDQDSSRFIVDAFQVLDWMKEKGGRFFSHKEGEAFFNEVKKIFTKRLPEQWQVPPKNPNFTGRDELLKQIADRFSKENVPVVLTTTHGLGGIGKTHLAIEFVWKHYQQYKGVVWFNSENRNRLLVDYIRLGEELHIIREDEKKRPIEERALLVKHWLEDPKRAGWLLVYDNALRYGGDEQGVGNLFPTKGGKILVTSRHAKGWPQNSFEVNIFTLKESRAYIKKVLGDKALVISQVDQLAETLGHLPLALAQACAYIKHTSISISGYLELYKTREEVREKEEAGKRELLSDKTLFDQTLLPDSHRAIVYITWDITIEAVRKESLLADKWLTICAYMNSDDIPNALLETFASSSENNSNQETFEAALETLGSYSMLTIDQEKSSASIHHLVQEVIKLQSEDKGKGADNRSTVFGLLKRCFPYGPDRFTLVDHTQKRQLLPHLEAFLPQLDIWLKEVSTEKLRSEIEKNCLAWLLERMANVYSDLGNALKQRELLEQVLTIKERHYRPDSPEVASALANLGNAYGALGDAHKQRELLERALPIVEHHFGHEYPVASTLTNLGNAYGALGDAHKKRELLERALTINERHYGPDHPEVAITLANLGNAYGALGDAHKKRDLLERALTINERHCGLDHPVVASTLVN